MQENSERISTDFESYLKALWTGVFPVVWRVVEVVRIFKKGRERNHQLSASRSNRYALESKAVSTERHYQHPRGRDWTTKSNTPLIDQKVALHN